MSQPTVTITDFLLPHEIAIAQTIFEEDPRHFVPRFEKEVIEPKLDRINASLGQENSPRFLTYMVQYILIQAKREHEARRAR